jgi:hypothetical protein
MAAAETPGSAVVEIDAGVCGHKTTTRATRGEGYNVRLTIDSSCPHVAKIAAELEEVDALREIGLRGGLPPLLATAYRHCIHAACPVPSGLVKAVEVASGLALPHDVHMCIYRGDEG